MWNILISFSNDATALFGIASSASPKTIPEPGSLMKLKLFLKSFGEISARSNVPMDLGP